MDELALVKDLGTMAAAAFTITQAFKMAGMPAKYAALVSIAIGTALAFAFALNPAFGLMAGLSASGLYSGMKKAGVKDSEDIVPEKVTENPIPHIE